MSRRVALGAATVTALPILLTQRSRVAVAMSEPHITLPTVAELLNDPDLTYGRITAARHIRAGEFFYTVAEATATNHQLVTGGGLKLYVVADIIRPEQFGATGNGDEMALLQTVLDYASGRAPVHFSRTYRIRPRNGREALFVRSNTRLVFEAGGKIENLPHDCIRYEMLKIHDANDVEIENAVLDGRRDLNAAKTGEWGHGIQVLGDVRNIRLRNPVTTNMWGDGIFVGQDLESLKSPVSVEIWNHRADNCRRQGMSITAAHRCIVHNPLWTNTNGTLPQSGLDIEPDTDSAVLGDIRIIDPVTRGNAGFGILVFLTLLRPSSAPVSIDISGHRSHGETDGAKFMRSGQGNGASRGLIRYRSAQVRNAKYPGIAIQEWSNEGPRIIIDDPLVENPGSLGEAEWDRAGITISNYANSEIVTIGNVSINRPSISYTRKTSDLDRYIYIQNYSYPGLIDNVSISDPALLKGTRYSRVDGKVSWSDRNEISTINHIDPRSPALICNWAFSGTYTNVGAKGIVTFQLAAKETPVGWPDVIVHAKGAYPIRILPEPTNRILPGGRPGQAVEIPAGGRLRLHRSSATEWTVVPASDSAKLRML